MKMIGNMLILGASGLVGHYLVNLFKDTVEYSLFCPSSEELNILDPESIEQYISSVKPDVIINTVAAHNMADKRMMRLCYEYNVAAIGNLIECLNGMKKPYKFVNYSTDYVFDGSIEYVTQGFQVNPGFYEDDARNGKSLYGFSKIMGEDLIKSRCEGTYYNIRIAGVYGVYPSTQKGGNFVLNMIKKSKAGVKELTMSSDVVCNQTYAEDIANFTETLLLHSEHYRSGEYNCTNECALSWYEFSLLVNEIFNLGFTIKPSDNSPADINRPKFTAMCTSLPSEILPRSPRLGLKAMLDEWRAINE